MKSRHRTDQQYLCTHDKTDLRDSLIVLGICSAYQFLFYWL